MVAILMHRAFYNEPAPTPTDLDATCVVVVAESSAEFTQQEITELAEKHGVRNILVETFPEYV